MKILVTGATGFVGSHLVPRLLAAGHSIQALVRDVSRAQARLGPEVRCTTSVTEACAGCDAVVNLAGEPIAGRRFSPAVKRAIRESRVELTEQLAAAAKAAVFVSGSAVGYYGDRGAELLDESSPSGDDFLARVCVDWEAAAKRASGRVVALRTGVVLGPNGGALQKMLPPFKLGAGGKLGSGKQYMPWIHLDDVCGVIERALADAAMSGPYALVAPQAVTNATFTATLGRLLRRPAVVPVPALGLRLLFGEAAEVLLASQNVVPRRLTTLGYSFRWPVLEAALRDVLR